MSKPELFDVIELLVDVPEHQQSIGTQGTIVECYDDGAFEVEFANADGETTALFALTHQQFIVVWKASTKQWLPTAEKITEILEQLSENKQEKIFDYARTIYQQA
ncbi:MAG: DUF4926 domain-containing protein [Phormidesmis sp.]